MAHATNDDILRAVLYYLGERFSTSSPAYSAASFRLPEVRDNLLRDMRWEFAVKLRELSHVNPVSSTTYPAQAQRFSHVYTIPSSVIRILGINYATDPEVSRGIDQEAQLVIAGNNLFTNVQHEGSATSSWKVWVWCIEAPSQPASWDPIFTELCIVDLALAVGFYATTNPLLIQYLARLRDNLYASAMKVTGIENAPDILTSRSGFLVPTAEAGQVNRGANAR